MEAVPSVPRYLPRYLGISSRQGDGQLALTVYTSMENNRACACEKNINVSHLLGASAMSMSCNPGILSSMTDMARICTVDISLYLCTAVLGNPGGPRVAPVM